MVWKRLEIISVLIEYEEGCVRTIVVWKLIVASMPSIDLAVCCVRTIVVWKRYGLASVPLPCSKSVA